MNVLSDKIRLVVVDDVYCDSSRINIYSSLAYNHNYIVVLKYGGSVIVYRNVSVSFDLRFRSSDEHVLTFIAVPLWTQGVTYRNNQVVSYDNGYYISLSDNNTAVPGDVNFWRLFNDSDVAIIDWMDYNEVVLLSNCDAGIYDIVKQLSCNEYIVDATGISVKYSLFYYEGAEATPIHVDKELNNSTDYLQFENDGVYVMKIKYTANNSDERVYDKVLFSFCKLEKCYVDLMMNILCVDDCDCSDDIIENKYAFSLIAAYYDIMLNYVDVERYINRGLSVLVSNTGGIIDTGFQNRLMNIYRTYKILNDILKRCGFCSENINKCKKCK